MRFISTHSTHLIDVAGPYVDNKIVSFRILNRD
jgi:hypothetical protein